MKTRARTTSWMFMLGTAVAAVIALSAATADAADTYFTGSGWWNNPANWLNGVMPTDGDTAYIDSSQTVNYQNTSNPLLTLVNIRYSSTLSQGQDQLSTTFLWVAYSSSATYNLSGTGQLTTGEVLLGGDGTGHGTFNQTGGTHNAGNLILGRSRLNAIQADTGIYNLSGGNLTALSTIVGDAGTGYFNHQDGGTHSVSGDLILGNQSGGSGNYVLYNSSPTGAVSLSVGGNAIVGNAGSGTFTGGSPFGGTNTFAVAGNLILGNEATGTGTVYVNQGAQVSVAASTNVGYRGTGSFTLWGGDHSTNTLVVGGGASSSSGSGTYVLQGWGNLATVDQVIGWTGAATGTFTHGYGVNSTGTLTLGRNNGSSGAYTLDVGQLDVTCTQPCQADMTVGDSGTGTFTQNAGGIVTVGNTLFLARGYSDTNTGTGTYTFNGGTLFTGETRVGVAGVGTFHQNDGGHITNNLVLGVNAGSSGTYNLANGSLWVSGNTTVGDAGAGIFNQTGGTHTTGALTIGTSGTYNYSGGTLSAGSIGNSGNFILSGASPREVHGGVMNNAGGFLHIFNTHAVFHDFVESFGTVKITGWAAGLASVQWLGGQLLHSGYISDPAQSFFAFLTIDATGYLVGEAGDEFYISGDFLNDSLSGSWNTALADLFFTGAGAHTFHLSDLDVANTWDTLSLLDGGILNLSSDTAVSLHVRDLIGGLGNIFNTGAFDIFIYEGDQLILRLPGSQQSVPEPSGLALLSVALVGLIALARTYRRRPTRR